jgi:hypothetical protein
MTAQPVETHVFPTLQGRCIEKDNHVAAFSIVGGEVARALFSVAAGVITASGVGAACALTAGTGCTAALAVGGTIAGALATGAVTLTASAIPVPAGAFAVMTPNNTNYVDVWGTIENPTAKNVGGPVAIAWNEKCAHHKGCHNGRETWHVRCEEKGSHWSMACPNMAEGNFKGKKMLVSPKRLPDKAWSEVIVGGC